MFSATLTFPTRQLATSFATTYSRKTLKGHTVSCTRVGGSTSVTCYNVTPTEKAWIDNYVEKLNKQLEG